MAEVVGGVSGVVTFSKVYPEIFSVVAVIVAIPAAIAVASPVELIFATASLDDPHVTVVEMSSVVPSEVFFMAANCCCVPDETLKFSGVTAMETMVEGVVLVTVNRVEPEMIPDVAVIVVEPSAAAVARPELLMVATNVFDDVHATELVRSVVALSEYIPSAAN